MSADLLDLDSDDWRRLDRLLNEALELNGDAQARFVDRLETEAPTDAKNLRRLLKAATTEGPLERPAFADFDEARLAIGTSVGPWRIDGLIGAGGMGEVYAASRHDEAYQQRVALKVLRQGIATPDAARRFRAERQCLALLEHPNITRLIDGGVLPDGRPYLAMTHVEGQPIDAWCQDANAPLDARLQLFLRLAHAVHYAHQRLIVHRDLKPTNILVSAEGQPVLLDFGIAKLLDQETEDGRTQETRAFTPGWAAPEQIAGRTATTATDVYGLGLVLYLLLTDRRPFEATTALSNEAPAPSTQVQTPGLAGRLRGDLDAIVRCALAVDPQARYGSAAAFAEDVLRHLNDEPVQAPGASRAARVAKAVRRHRWPVALGATIVLALSGYAAIVTLQAHELRAKEVARQRSADRADRVAGFLVDLLASGDPRHGEVSVAELVDTGARRLQSDLRDLPLVRREVAVALAQAQLALGKHEEAGRLTSAAIEAFKAQPPTTVESQTTQGRALLLLSRVRFRQGKLQESEALAQAAQQIGDVGDGGRLNADVREWRGTLAHEHFDFQAARRHHQVAFQIREALLGETAPDTIRAALRISEMHVNLRESKPSQLWRDRAAAALERSEAPARDLVEGYLLMAHLVEGGTAQDMWRERAIEALVGVYGEHHPEVADALNDYGLSLEMRDPERAVTYLARALEVTEAYYGEKTPRVVKARLNLGAVLRDAGHLTRAAPLLERALEIGREVYPPTSRHLAYPLTHLSQLRHQQGRLEEAERLGVELVTLLTQHPKMSSHKGISHYRLAQILIDQGRIAAADTHLHNAVAALRPRAEPPFAEVTLAWAQTRSTLKRPLNGDLLAAINTALASTKTASVTRQGLIQARAKATPARTGR